MARSDNYGMFWQDEETAGRGQPVNRPVPPIPNTGWRPPDFFPSLASAKMISIDCETYDPELTTKGPGVRRGGYIVGVAVGTDDGFRGYFPMRHKMGGNLDPDTVLTWLNDELAGTTVPKVGANLLYDLDYLSHAGVDTGEGPNYDVQNAEPLLDEYKRSYSLDILGDEYLGEGKTSEALYRWSAAAYGGKPTSRDQGRHIWQCPVQLVGPYAEGDVDLPIRIFEQQKKRLEAEALWDVFELETALIPMLLAMRQRGVRIDFTQADIVQRQLEELLMSLNKDLGGISVNSSEEIARMCDKAGIAYPRTKPSTNYPNGNPSFQKDWLKNHPHPLMRKLSEARTYQKYKDTFITSYLHGNQVGGRIHCMFNQLRSDDLGTVSGRFSSSNPNLQNIPKRGKGKVMRSPFVPDEGEDWGRFDWSQIEFRLLVNSAVGPGSAEAVAMYNDNASTDFHVMVQELTDLERDPAKTINFGLVYGMGLETLCESLGVSKERGSELLTVYHKKVPFVKTTYDLASRTAKNRGYIRTLLGRRARFPGGEYSHKGLNRALQGGAADIMKAAMVQIWDSGICDVLGAPLLTVHDELDWSVPRTEEANEAMRECKHIMETCVKIKVPLIAEEERGSNWATCAPYKE